MTIEAIEKVVSDMIEITLPDQQNFLKVRETLTRIGVANRDKKLFQSCHILQKRGKYYIVHFKEMFMLDGKSADFSDEDKGRRNQIANLLANEWKLVGLVEPKKSADPITPISKIKILKYDKYTTTPDNRVIRNDGWELIPKYRIGEKSRKKQNEETSS